MKKCSKKIILITLTFLTLRTNAVYADVQGPNASQVLQQGISEVGEQGITDTNYKRGLIKHIVLFRYRASVTTQEKQQVIKRFLALGNSRRNGRHYILSIETGAQMSGEGVDQNLEQGFIVTFKSEGDRNYYVGYPIITNPAYFDPAHQEFKDFVGPLLHTPINPTGVIVFDFKL